MVAGLRFPQECKDIHALDELVHACMAGELGF